MEKENQPVGAKRHREGGCKEEGNVKEKSTKAYVWKCHLYANLKYIFKMRNKNNSISRFPPFFTDALIKCAVFNFCAEIMALGCKGTFAHYKHSLPRKQLL